MPLFTTRRSKARLMPELDDQPLGKVLKPLRQPPMPGMTDIQVGLLAQLPSASHRDWDRKAHRVSVLAQCVMASQLPEAWLAHNPHDAIAIALHG
ncbi:hypothetical protein ACWDWU_11470 [Streptomyces sp. NPDC003442]